MTTKHQNRKIRVLRLLAVVQAYHYYTMMNVQSELLQHDNSWQEAEFLSNLINMLLPYQDCSPTEFIYDKDDVSEEVLKYYDEFIRWKKFAEKVGISEKTVTAFCKNVDHMNAVFPLKIFGHIYYSDWLMAYYLYLENAISKTDLQKSFVEFSLFSGKTKPANFIKFKKTVLEIEKIIMEITKKQIYREIKKKLFF